MIDVKDLRCQNPKCLKCKYFIELQMLKRPDINKESVGAIFVKCSQRGIIRATKVRECDEFQSKN